jgi:hypothetical protein
MSQKTIVQLFDDLDGTSTEDIQTISFALDGVEYEIDLSGDNASKLALASSKNIITDD